MSSSEQTRHVRRGMLSPYPVDPICQQSVRVVRSVVVIKSSAVSGDGSSVWTLLCET